VLWRIHVVRRSWGCRIGKGIRTSWRWGQWRRRPKSGRWAWKHRRHLGVEPARPPEVFGYCPVNCKIRRPIRVTFESDSHLVFSRQVGDRIWHHRPCWRLALGQIFSWREVFQPAYALARSYLEESIFWIEGPT
jgi:hypothetical protein